ncbi:hypothetical protein Tco_0127044 [Tanacetum coccineum]
MFDKAFKMVSTFKDFRIELVEGKEKRAGIELVQEITKKQKVEDDKETAEIKQLMNIIPDEEEVATDAIPLAVRCPSIVDWKIHKEGRKSYYQIIRADGKSQMHMFFSQMLKSFDREDLEDFYKLVKAKYESTRPVEDLDLLLWGDLKTMFEPHVEDEIYMLVEKKYPLAPLTLSMMLEKKLMIDYESEMAYQLLKFIMKQLKNILGPMRFVSKSDDFQVYGELLPKRMTNQQIRDSVAYKTYLTYVTGAALPKMKRKLKKPASPSKKRTLVKVEEEEYEPTKKDKPATKVARTKGIRLLYDAALLKEVQLKNALRRSKRETTIHQAGGSSAGVNSESKVHDEQKGKSIDTSEGTSLKPGVLDVSKGDSSKSEYELWGDSKDEDADDQQGDDERTGFDDEPTKTDNTKTSDDEEEMQDDEYVHTPNDYVPTSDETKYETYDVTGEEYERINEELYGDVNVSLTDAEPADKEKVDEEITVIGPIPSSSISFDYAVKYLNFDNIPPVDTEFVSMLKLHVPHLFSPS